MQYIITIIIFAVLRGSKGFDGVIEVGEAIRRYALNPQLKINAEDNLAYAA